MKDSRFWKYIAIIFENFINIPVSVASEKRNFSKLKLIKHELGSLISQTKIRYLSLISSESTLAAFLDYTLLINEFAQVKVKTVNCSILLRLIVDLIILK